MGWGRKRPQTGNEMRGAERSRERERSEGRRISRKKRKRNVKASFCFTWTNERTKSNTQQRQQRADLVSSTQSPSQSHTHRRLYLWSALSSGSCLLNSALTVCVCPDNSYRLYTLTPRKTHVGYQLLGICWLSVAWHVLAISCLACVGYQLLGMCWLSVARHLLAISCSAIVPRSFIFVPRSFILSSSYILPLHIQAPPPPPLSLSPANPPRGRLT